MTLRDYLRTAGAGTRWGLLVAGRAVMGRLGSDKLTLQIGYHCQSLAELDPPLELEYPATSLINRRRLTPKSTQLVGLLPFSRSPFVLSLLQDPYSHVPAAVEFSGPRMVHETGVWLRRGFRNEQTGGLLFLSGPSAIVQIVR